MSDPEFYDSPVAFLVCPMQNGRFCSLTVHFICGRGQLKNYQDEKFRTILTDIQAAMQTKCASLGIQYAPLNGLPVLMGQTNEREDAENLTIDAVLS